MVAQQTIPNILQAIDGYNPQMEMILLVKDGSQLEVDILQKSPFTPVECYQQVCPFLGKN